MTPPSWSITSVTAEAKHIAKMAGAAEPSAADDATRVVAQDTPSHRADAGMAWGTLIHGLLEHAMRHKDATREDLRRLAMWLTVEEPQLRAVIDEALDTVERAARADFWSVAQSHAALGGDAVHRDGLRPPDERRHRPAVRLRRGLAGRGLQDGPVARGWPIRRAAGGLSSGAAKGRVFGCWRIVVNVRAEFT